MRRWGKENAGKGPVLADTAGLEKVAGYDTRVIRYGAGPRAALFLHASMGNAKDWTGVQAELLEQLTMTAFDRPSHGRAPRWQGGDALALFEQSVDMAGALIDGQADVIAHSFGATVALGLALKMPEKVRSLTLYEPVLFGAIKERPEPQAFFGTMGRFQQLIEAGDEAEAARLFNDAIMPEAPWAALPEPIRAAMARRIHVIADEGPVVMGEVADLANPARLAGLNMPVQFLHGSRSPAMFGAVIAYFCAHIPQAQRKIIGGAGHMGPLTHPRAIAMEIEAFLRA